MKPKTLILLVVIGLFLFLLITFTQFGSNQAVLSSSLGFFGLHFSVFKLWIFSMLLAGAFPAAFFTKRYLDLLRQQKNAAREAKEQQRIEEQLQNARNLISHGQASKVMETLNGNPRPEAHILQAKAHFLLKQYDHAQPLLRRAFYDEKQVEAGYLLSECLVKLGQNGLDPLQTLIDRFPKEAGRAYESLLQYHEAHKNWSTCQDLATTMRKLGLPLAPERELAHRYEFLRSAELPLKKAIEGYNQLIKEAPEFVPARLGLADLYMTEKDPEKAFKVYEAAFAKTGHSIFLTRLEKFYLGQDRPEDAIQIYRQLMVRHGSPVIKYQLAKLYFQLQMFDESLKVLEPLKNIAGQTRGWLYYLAEGKARTKHESEALKLWRTLYALDGPGVQDYRCTHCKSGHQTWKARCEVCGNWNRIELEIGIEKQEIAQPQAPLYY